MKKKKDIILVSLGSHAKVLLNIIERDYKDSFRVIGYVDNEKKDYALKYFGKDETLIEIYQKGICENLVIGIGKTKIYSNRENIIENLLKIGFNFPIVISKKSIVNKNVSIGKGTQVLDNAVINCNVKIGNFCILNTSSVVEHDVFVGDYSHLAPSSVVCGGSKIGKRCFMGANSTIIQNLTLCDDVFIGANGLVQKDIKKSGIYCGVPVKKIK